MSVPGRARAAARRAEAFSMSVPGRSQTLVPQRAARRPCA